MTTEYWQGNKVAALDFTCGALEHLRQEAIEHGVPIRVLLLNSTLKELRELQKTLEGEIDGTMAIPD